MPPWVEATLEAARAAHPWSGAETDKPKKPGPEYAEAVHALATFGYNQFGTNVATSVTGFFQEMGTRFIAYVPPDAIIGGDAKPVGRQIQTYAASIKRGGKTGRVIKLRIPSADVQSPLRKLALHGKVILESPQGSARPTAAPTPQAPNTIAPVGAALLPRADALLSPAGELQMQTSPAAVGAAAVGADAVGADAVGADAVGAAVVNAAEDLFGEDGDPSADDPHYGEDLLGNNHFLDAMDGDDQPPLKKSRGSKEQEAEEEEEEEAGWGDLEVGHDDLCDLPAFAELEKGEDLCLLPAAYPGVHTPCTPTLMHLLHTPHLITPAVCAQISSLKTKIPRVGVLRCRPSAPLAGLRTSDRMSRSSTTGLPTTQQPLLVWLRWTTMITTMTTKAKGRVKTRVKWRTRNDGHASAAA